ncbi:hypothetical protein Fmac_017969 [Flemingia macrophylla]|uniref:Uncharacterized protein n=1 Tax=Flemingia macrophylla TaxID=520843 RepID=A0ABD1M3P2_9FABA
MEFLELTQAGQHDRSAKVFPSYETRDHKCEEYVNELQHKAIWVLDGSEPGEVVRLTVDDLVGLNVVGGGSGPSRVNTWHNVLVTMQKRTKQLVAQREGKVSFEPFPSLVVTADGVSQG